MKFPTPLIRGKLVRRYKRFLADIEIEADTGAAALVTAHCANPGSMIGLVDPGSEVWLSIADNPARKQGYTWELVRVGRSLVGVNPALANRLTEEAVADGRIAELAGYHDIRREVRYGDRSRIDLLLGKSNRPNTADAYVEVKSVTLRRPPSKVGEFPDAVTARGTKHLGELQKIAAAGYRAVMLFVVQRGDCQSMTTATDIDPVYAAALWEAGQNGVEIYCYGCSVRRNGIQITSPLPILAP